MSQSHLFILDPLESLNLKLDSSLRLAFAISQAGHKVFAAPINLLSWSNSRPQGDVSAARIVFSGDIASARFDTPQAMSLAHFAGIHMRKDPPFDLDYITATWMLESAADVTRIYNHPTALRSLNEKLSIFNYPAATRTAVASSRPQDLMDFWKSLSSLDAVLKPINQYGGRGVRRLKIGVDGVKSEADLVRILNSETCNGTQLRLIQEFDPAIHQGEVRAFCVGGEPLAWCLKKPAEGQFLANTRAGATLHTYSPTGAERERVTSVARDLKSRGVEIVGFDLLGGFVSEINLTSPRLLQAEDDKENYYAAWANWTIRDCAR